MDKNYICPRLKSLASLLYGKDSKPFAKEKNGKYLFGSKKPKKVVNKVSKAIAIYLVIGNLKQLKENLK